MNCISKAGLRTLGGSIHWIGMTMSNAGVLRRRHRVSNPEPFGGVFLLRGEGHHAATGDLHKVARLAPSRLHGLVCEGFGLLEKGLER